MNIICMQLKQRKPNQIVNIIQEITFHKRFSNNLLKSFMIFLYIFVKYLRKRVSYSTNY